ncbi:hypothetical protein F6Y05_01665 (plasmid) [Bacillus megaterium]|nr:hypothetical protein [Priestia megaterium]
MNRENWKSQTVEAFFSLDEGVWTYMQTTVAPSLAIPVEVFKQQSMGAFTMSLWDHLIQISWMNKIIS